MPAWKGSETADVAQGRRSSARNARAVTRFGDAATQGSTPSNPVAGPKLDAAFADARREGFSESTIRAVVRDQIAYPTPPMPKNLLTGSDADAVAAYVALVAGKPGVGAPEPGRGGGGKALFVTNCGPCHTLAAAGTSGTVGPNLDSVMPSLELAVRQITKGGAVMPPFHGRLTSAQIRAIAEYVSSNAGR